MKAFIYSRMLSYKNSMVKRLCLFTWRKEAKLHMLRSFESAIKLQLKPAIPRQCIFTLMKLDSLIIFEKSWKEWIGFVRMRHAFKQFLKTFKRREPERELKGITLYSLKRAAVGNLIKRLVHQANRFYPNKLMISLEGTKWDLQRSP
jgi:hypothetical protein